MRDPSKAEQSRPRSRLARDSRDAVHPGDLPAQLPVGACPSTRPREPPVVGPGLGRWGRTRRLAPDHRPGLDHLRDLWTGQGGSAPPRLYRRPRLSPAAGHCRRHRRGADVPAARGPGRTPPVAPPTSCVRRWGGCATVGPGDNSRWGAGRRSSRRRTGPLRPYAGVAACAGWRDGYVSRGLSRTGVARDCGDVGSVAGWPSGWEWNGSQSGQGAAELLLPGPAPGKMQGQPACRAGDPSGQGKDPSSEGLGESRSADTRPMRAVQRARLCAITCTASQAPLAAKRPEGRWFSPTPYLRSRIAFSTSA